MFWNNRELREFVKSVSADYSRTEESVKKFIIEEYDDMLEYSKERRSESLKRRCLSLAIEHCKEWLLEERRERITVEDLESFRSPKLFFTSIVKRG